MNLPTNLNSKGGSSESDDDADRKDSHIIEELKRKSNHNKFQLKEINHDLVLQKYEDMMRSSEDETAEREEETEVNKE
jgi:hypothetical protein